MVKLTHILAASFGGGLVLGAGIRLGETLASRGTPDRVGTGFSGDLESRMAARLEKHAAEVSSMRSQLVAETRQIEALGEISLRLREELPELIEKSVDRRIEEAEAALRTESERSRNEAIETLIDGVQARVANRLSRLEEEVSMHSAAMAELRACSLRTEASIGKLAESLDRLLSAKTAIAAARSD